MYLWFHHQFFNHHELNKYDFKQTIHLIDLVYIITKVMTLNEN